MIRGMATKWLSPQEMSAWRAFIAASNDLWRVVDRDLGAHGLDGGDYQLLAMLSEAPDQRLRLCDLAETLRLTRSGLTRRMDGVLKKKLVARVQSTEDGRVAYAQMTPKGVELLKVIAPEHLRTVRRMMFDHLTPAEVKAMASGLGKVAAKLETEL
jgi:DNA-binding MarR family transcriptional regulator